MKEADKITTQYYNFMHHSAATTGRAPRQSSAAATLAISLLLWDNGSEEQAPIGAPRLLHFSL